MSARGIRIAALNGATFFLLFLLLMFPGRLRYDRSETHLGGAEFAISPFYIPLFFCLILSIISHSKKAIIDTPVKVGLWYIAAIAITTVWATIPYWSILEVFRIAACFVVFCYAAKFFSDYRAYNWMAAAICLVVIVQAVASALQAQTGVTFGGLDMEEASLSMTSATSFRVAGTLVQPGTFAQFLTILFPLMAASIAKSGNSFLKIAVMAAIPVLLAFSQSRTGIVVFFISASIIFIAYLRGSKYATRKFLISSIILIFSCASALFLWSTIAARFVQSPQSSASTREMLAEIAFQMISKNPIWGVGLNNFTEVMRSYDTTGISYSLIFPVHNIYLLIASETGMFGLFAFLLLNFYFITLAMKNIKSGFSHAYKSASFYALNGLIVIYLTGMLGWAWKTDTIQILYWLCLAIIVADRREIKRLRFNESIQRR